MHTHFMLICVCDGTILFLTYIYVYSMINTVPFPFAGKVLLPAVVVVLPPPPPPPATVTAQDA